VTAERDVQSPIRQVAGAEEGSPVAISLLQCVEWDVCNGCVFAVSLAGGSLWGDLVALSSLTTRLTMAWSADRLSVLVFSPPIWGGTFSIQLDGRRSADSHLR